MNFRKFETEREGQIAIFNTFINDYQNNDVLIDNSDAVWKWDILEFKLNISNVNCVLCQAIKYFSKMRIKGESVSNILLISLNKQICYHYKSQNYFDDIHEVYYGVFSKNNDNFILQKYEKKIDYSTLEGQLDVLNLLRENTYIPIKIDENCIVGWAERYYKFYPKATKGVFIDGDTGKVNLVGKIRNHKFFRELILSYEQKTSEKLKYLMDKLNDKLKKKTLGLLYTPIPYCAKAKELVEMPIAKVPEGNDYIILDRYEYYEYKVLCERLGDEVGLSIPPVEMEDTYDRGFLKCADAMPEEYINNTLIKKYIDDDNSNIIILEDPPYYDTSSITGEYDDIGQNYVINSKESYVFLESS